MLLYESAFSFLLVNKNGNRRPESKFQMRVIIPVTRRRPAIWVCFSELNLKAPESLHSSELSLILLLSANIPGFNNNKKNK